MTRFALPLLLASLAGVAVAAEPKPLGTAGKELFAESFAKPKLADTWKTGPGTYEVGEGVLKVSEKKDDMHVAAFRAMTPAQDVIVECQFKFDGAKAFHVGFDPAAGELPGRKGHLVNVILTDKTMVIQKPADKEDTAIKAKQLAKADVKLDDKEWHTLRVATVGGKIQAVLDGKTAAEGEDTELKVKKPAVVFRVGGESVSLKSVVVSEAK
jgi:hypothetical protein